MNTAPASLTMLRIGATVTALLSILQPVLYLLKFAGVSGVMKVHGITGQAMFVMCVFAAVSAILWARASGNKGLMGHAIGLAIGALAQVALGELKLTTLHITLGIAMLAGAIALAVLAYRKPGSPTTPVAGEA